VLVPRTVAEPVISPAPLIETPAGRPVADQVRPVTPAATDQLTALPAGLLRPPGLTSAAEAVPVAAAVSAVATCDGEETADQHGDRAGDEPSMAGVLLAVDERHWGCLLGRRGAVGKVPRRCRGSAFLELPLKPRQLSMF